MSDNRKDPNGIGLAVDAAGGPAIDPSLNVIALNNAASARQDDLRDAYEKFHERENANIKEMATMRYGYEREIRQLRSHYETRLSEAEAKRIDAIRAVDVNAVAVANERQVAAATVLANQVASSADALRTLVATTASALAEQIRVQFAQTTDRLTAVERSQYEGRGKAGLADPMMSELILEVKSLRESRSGSSGKSEGGQAVWAYIALGVSLISVLIGGAFALVAFMGKV